jgi:hypothetical protein
VDNRDPLDGFAVGVDDTDGVVVLSPVRPGRRDSHGGCGVHETRMLHGDVGIIDVDA